MNRLLIHAARDDQSARTPCAERTGVIPTSMTELPVANRVEWLLGWTTDPTWMLTEVYSRYSADVRRRASSICNADMASDVAQETFLRLWRNPSGFDPERGPLATYLMVVARGIALDLVRSDSRRRRRDQRAHGLNAPRHAADVAVFEPILRQETATRVMSAMADLEPRQRQAIEMTFFDETTFSQAARAHGISEGTVKSRVRVGLSHMRPALADLGAPADEK